MNKRQFMKTVVGGSAAALAAKLGISPAIAAEQPLSIPLLLCPSGCGPSESDTILMTQMVHTGSKITLLPQETPGYIYDIREMKKEQNRKTTVFSTEDVLIQLALKWGGKPEMKEFLPEPVPIKFKLLYGEAWWPIGKFFVTFDPNIKSVADLKGKRISLGLRSQSDWGVYSRMFLDAYGINPSNTDIRHLIPSSLTQQLIDGSTDAAVTVFGMEPNMKEWMIGSPLRQLEAAGKPLYYLGVDQEIIAKVNRKWDTTFTHVVVPANTLPGQHQPLSVGNTRGYKAAAPDFPEESAYRLVKSVAKIAPSLRNLHILWKIWSPELMLAGLSDENVHPGAKRAYQELGWWDKTKKYEPMTYPA